MLESAGEGSGIDALRAVQDVLLVAFVGAVAYTDWRWRRIPNAITYPTVAVGLVLGLIEGPQGDLGLVGEVFRGGALDHLAGLALAFAVSYPFYVAGGLKAGDGKLLMAVGALRGTTFLLGAAIYGALLGGVIALVFIGLRRLTPARDGERTTMGALMRTWIPYGIALGGGALVALGIEVSRLS